MPILVPVLEVGAVALEGSAVAAEGGAVAGGAVEAAAEIYGGIRVLLMANAAAKVIDTAAAAKNLADADTADPCPTCKKKDPCEDLKQGKGKGRYRGGSHGEMSKPTNDGLDSHHMPSSKALEVTGAMSRNDGAAIQMLPADHAETLSWGSSTEAQAYRAQQAELIDQGKYLEAFEKDAADVKKIAQEAGDPTRYDEAIEEARAYAKCREQNQGD